MKLVLMTVALLMGSGVAAQSTYQPTTTQRLAELQLTYQECVLTKSRKIPATVTEPAKEVAAVLARGCGWAEFVGTVEATFQKAARGMNIDKYMTRTYAIRDAVIESAAVNITEGRMAQAGVL